MCKYCEGTALGCLHCAHACMLEKWHENAERCKMCKGAARESIGDLPRFVFCPYCGRRLPVYKPDGERQEKAVAQKKPGRPVGCRHWTRGEEAALIRLRMSGVKIKDCAEALDRTEKQVANKLGDLTKRDDMRAMLGMRPLPKKEKKQ